MKVTRTGNIQTERTASGVITTAEERVTPTKGKAYKRWVSIGYTSIWTNESDGKQFVDGPVGKRLAGRADIEEMML